MSSIEEKIRALPLALQIEVEDFVSYLEERRHPVGSGKPSFKWAGALSGLSSQYSSVELQHALAQWRTLVT